MPSHMAELSDTTGETAIPGRGTGDAPANFGTVATENAGDMQAAEANAMPTFLGDAPAIPAQRETPANTPPSPEPSADSQDIGPPTPASSQTIQTPIDQPGDVPGLYSDMTGGM